MNQTNSSEWLRAGAALISGIVFGLGLALSGIVNPARVQGFLDIFGEWDPTLAFVLGGAVLVALASVALQKRFAKPLFDESFHLPATRPVDKRLIVGSAIFGLGWGLGGFCPGPALASLSVGYAETILFVMCMLAGMVAHDQLTKKRP
ncbi:YeeE/YedE family protein [Ochrobactrum sp. CM-21-5]|nr:DUF6691 family protein [Ochrobactrum sp. CM-21-5]MBC2885643.1 YeeE/YedE family protein [Ochrobactrum sp. CM-21-5]